LSSGSGTERSGVRHRRLLQISRRAGRAEREMGGGSAQACHAVEGYREKEAGGRAWSVVGPRGRNGFGRRGRRWQRTLAVEEGW
jgi:hypothetical protein